jgi:hypothetical protein
LLRLYAALRAVDVLLSPVLVARRRQRFLFWYFLALLFAVAATTALGARLGGAPGAVMLLTPVYGGLMVIITKEVLAELEGSFSELWCQTWPILAATAAMAALVLLLREITFGMLPEPLKLILLPVGGALTYLGALFMLGRTVIGEIAEVIGWALRRLGDDS